MRRSHGRTPFSKNTLSRRKYLSLTRFRVASERSSALGGVDTAITVCLSARGDWASAVRPLAGIDVAVALRHSTRGVLTDIAVTSKVQIFAHDGPPCIVWPPRPSPPATAMVSGAAHDWVLILLQSRLPRLLMLRRHPCATVYPSPHFITPTPLIPVTLSSRCPRPQGCVLAPTSARSRPRAHRRYHGCRLQQP